MAKTNALLLIITLFLTTNLLFLTLVSSTTTPCPPPPPPPTNTPCPPPPPHKSGHKNQPPNAPISKGKCPKDTLKLGVCANLLNDLVHLVVGSPSTTPCCSLIEGLADLEAAVCLCTAVKANVLGINLNVPISLSLLLNNCGKHVPNGYQCQ